ncbi:MAG: NADH-quinone oxidoreductase subunit M [Chitinophagaceae bacterium]
MILVSLILIPLVFGLGSFFLKGTDSPKTFALIASILSLAASLYAISIPVGSLTYSHGWLGTFNSNFSLGADGLAKILILLTAVSYPIIFIATSRNQYKDTSQFYALMLLVQAGLMGVFLSTDCLLFYFFWELALIPAYFLCSKWGGDKRIQVSFKFFIYTFIGSLIMLIGIIYLYSKTSDHSFAWSSFSRVVLTDQEQKYFFWFFFIAFAIKMPIFPLHTWQPDTYEQAPTATTMVLSGVMVKMGLFAVARWLIPVFPQMAVKMADTVMILSIIGMIYASLIAMKQDSIKRMIAYSSIAHIGLMCAALFANNAAATQGVYIQLFNHGVNVIGLWIVANAIEQQTGTTKMSELGGLAYKAPVLAILLVVMALANIALPLTNAFVGEFLMFNGIFAYKPVFAAVAIISIVLAAVYTLNMIQKVFLGEASGFLKVTEIPKNTIIALSIIVLMIFAMGVYPNPMFHLGEQVMGWAMKK